MTEAEFLRRVMPMQRTIYACAVSILRDTDEASDCTQDVVTRLWESRSRLRDIENLEAYCMAAARRGAIDRLRSASRKPAATIDELPETPDPDVPPDIQLEQRTDLEDVRSMLALLPERQRELVEMSGIGGLSNDEIREATGLSPENVRVLLSRGRRRLKELFSRRQN